MDLINRIFDKAADFGPALGSLALILGILALINWALKRRWQHDHGAQFRFQLIMLLLTFAGIVLVIVMLPEDAKPSGEFVTLIGILLSAAIALSSTTFIGNIMAGMMLKVVKSARPGDFITVADLTGRITEMGLLHTEVQTEFRDLVTVPNMYMVNQPMKVVRASGTIISAEISLGYDVSHIDISKILCESAAQAGLKDGFVHVRQLGDFSVSYRVAGLLEDVKSLISARSRLREMMLDALHAADIEIVSANFMNTRAISDGTLFIPKPSRKKKKKESTQAEDIVFDKAEEAASVEDIRKAIEIINDELATLDEAGGDATDVSKDRLIARRSDLGEQLEEAEEQKKAAELKEKAGSGKD